MSTFRDCSFRFDMETFMKAADRTNLFELQHTISALSLWGLGLYDKVRISVSFVNDTDKYPTELVAVYQNTEDTDAKMFVMLAIWNFKTGKFETHS